MSDTKTLKTLTLQSLKRTHDLFQGNHGQRIPLDELRCALRAFFSKKVRDGIHVAGLSQDAMMDRINVHALFVRHSDFACRA